MAEVTETLLDKKLEQSSWEQNPNTNNFTVENELTVTITLKEYRDLIKSDSIKDSKIEELRNETYKLQRERSELEKKNQELLIKIANSFVEPTEEGEADE